MGHLKPFGSVNKIKTIGANMQMLSDELCDCDVYVPQKEGISQGLPKAKCIITVCQRWAQGVEL